MVVMSPYEGFQSNFASTGVDVCVAGGGVGVGKTAAAWFSVAEDFQKGEFRGVFLRNNIDDFKAGGGLLDVAEEIYGSSVKVIRSDNPRVEYLRTGAVVEVTHVADQTREKVEQRFKGRQIDKIYFDEGTGFTWDTFVTIASRNRGRSGCPQILITTNPKRKHWLRKMVDWYLNEDGTVDDSRCGVVRYFFVNGESVDDLVWGMSKDEVYGKCRGAIDRLIRGAYGSGVPPLDAWKSCIKSFTYYQGRMAENKANMERNPNYLGSVAMAGGAYALNYIEGNWNADPDDERDCLLSANELRSVFDGDEQRNGDLWITCDLADFGTDNFVALAWDGLHVFDMCILTESTPKMNAEVLRSFAMSHDVGFRHIIYDAVRGRYINDYIPEAIPYESNRASMGKSALQYMKLKDCCYGKLVNLIRKGCVTVSDDLAKRKYIHQKMKSKGVTVEEEFMEEMRVVRFIEAQSGKIRLMTKKEMNRELGRGRSMDLADPMAMRMYPLLKITDGEELESTRPSGRNTVGGGFVGGDTVDIYDDRNWF